MAKKVLDHYSKSTLLRNLANVYEWKVGEAQRELWTRFDPDDMAKRLMSLNCMIVGLSERDMKRMPKVAFVETQSLRVCTKEHGELSTPLRKPLQVPVTLVFAIGRLFGSRHINSYSLMNGKLDSLAAQLPEVGAEMIGPEAVTAMRATLETVSAVQSQASRMRKNVDAAMGATKSPSTLCSVLPFLRDVIPEPFKSELPHDLTKARGDVRKVMNAYDVGEMIQLSLQFQAYYKQYLARKV